MTAPEPEHPPLEADLGTLTNEQWLADHRALQDLNVLPDNELRYLYDPDQDPSTVDPDELLLGGGISDA